MSTRRIKWKKHLTRAFTASFLLAVTVVAGSFVWSWLETKPARLNSVEIRGKQPFHVGDTVTCRITSTMPFQGFPAGELDIDLPEAIQQLSTSGPRLGSWRFTRWSWTYRVQLQPLRTGTFNNLSVTIPITGLKTPSRKSLQAKLPSIEVTSRHLPPDESPKTAKQIPLTHSSPPWLLIGTGIVLVLLVAAIAVCLFLRQRHRATTGRQPAAPDPRTKAEQRLRELEADMPLDPERFFVRITDIVRTYFEDACGWRAQEQTTPEFLKGLDDAETLSESQKELLRTFLTTADKIKFARLQASEDDLKNALQQAQQIIA